MLEGIICPACENSIDEIDLKDSLKCPHCNNDLKDRKYLDFLEFLMANGIVENLDFFDQEGIEILSMRNETNRLEELYLKLTNNDH